MTRLGPDRLDEIFRGTLHLLAEHGFEAITMDQVAEATQSSKATLYRQWGSKSTLVTQALYSVTLADDSPVDTGSLRGDLLEMVRRQVPALEDGGALIGAILQAVKVDPGLRVAVREQVVAVARQRLANVVDRAVARGEVAADHPATAYLSMVLFAPFVLREVLDDKPADKTYLTGYVDAVLLPVLATT